MQRSKCFPLAHIYNLGCPVLCPPPHKSHGKWTHFTDQKMIKSLLQKYIHFLIAWYFAILTWDILLKILFSLAKYKHPLEFGKTKPER